MYRDPERSHEGHQIGQQECISPNTIWEAESVQKVMSETSKEEGQWGQRKSQRIVTKSPDPQCQTQKKQCKSVTVWQWFPNCEPQLPWEPWLPRRGAANYYNFSQFFLIYNFISLCWCQNPPSILDIWFHMLICSAINYCVYEVNLFAIKILRNSTSQRS